MLLVSSKGHDSILVVGEGVSGDSTPFSSEAGKKVLGLSLMSLGLSPHLIEFRKQNYDEVIDSSLIEETYNYIKTNNITRVISLGKSATVALFPSITKSHTMSSLVDSPMTTPQEIDVKVGVMNHPITVLNSTDDEAIIEWIEQLNNLLTKKNDVEVDVNKIESAEEFIQLLSFLNSLTTNYLGLDYETNAVDPFNINFYTTMIGLSYMVSPTKAVAFHWHNPKVIPDFVLEAYGEFLIKNAHRIWTYNVAFEMKVSWHLVGKFIKMQDAMVLLTAYAKRSSLKHAIRAEFGAMMWEASVNEFKTKAAALFKLITKASAKDPEYITACKSGNLDFWKPDPDSSDKSGTEIINWMLENYDRSEVSEAISHYPYEWGSVPKDMLGVYCARDAGYTVLLANKYNTPEIQLAYNVFIRHPWLAVKFEVNGVSWDDIQANILDDEIYIKKLDLLYKLVMDSTLSPEKKMEATDIYYRPLPYTVISYTEKTKKEKRREVTTLAEKIEDIKSFFNPGSNTADSRAKFWDVYATDEIQLATVLLLFLEDIELSGKLPELHELVGGKNFLYQNRPNAVMERLVELTQIKSPIVSQIRSSLAKCTNMLSDNMGRFASEVIKFQYQVHTTFLGLDLSNQDTWSKEWQMLFNIFLYKKYDKVQGTNIKGTNGRASVNAVIGTLHGKPLRGTSYNSIYPSKIKEYPMVLNTDFNSLAAATLRWTAGWHTIPAGSPSRRILSVPNPRAIWAHADYSQAELVVLAYLSQDKGMIQSFIDGKDMHKFVASKVFQKPYDEVTSEERRAAKAVGFGIIYGKSVENTAIEVTNGDVERAQALFDTFFGTFPGIKIWMEERRKELDKYGYVTNLFGGRLAVDTNLPGNGKYRVAINAPIQCSANIVAGTSIYQFTEWCEEQGIPTLPIGFTHDALDDVLQDVDYLFEYVDGLVFKLQDEVYQKLGIPMRIDFEIGADSFNQSSFDIQERDGNKLVVEMKGTKESNDKLLDIFKLSNTFSVTGTELLSSKSTVHGYEELFTVGKALKDEYGKTIITETVKVEFMKSIRN